MKFGMACGVLLLACSAVVRNASAQAMAAKEPALDRHQLALAHFGADARWYEQNIPFFEIDDPQIEEIYYYRWKVFRSHIREIGEQGTTVLEFLADVPWARAPYTDLNDSTSFHILEGRWLRSSAVVDSLIDHEYSGGGNDRHFSESIAAATEASSRVTGDASVGLRHLDTMRYVYNAWDDHFDRARNLYWIEPLLDATEYTISSIDASGAGFTDKPAPEQNRNGFTGGFAYRPSINSYQFANALAIAQFAALAGEPAVAADYAGRAEALRKAVLDQLWNPALQHFTDRYQRATKTVTAGEFVRGRELVGYTPWLYGLPPKQSAVRYAEAWNHALSAEQLGGPFGLRTVEPTYPKYMQQYRYDAPTGLAECQWNGPSWPFQTSQTLTAMANLLEDYPAAGVTATDYLRLLRQYTAQHFVAGADGSAPHPDLQEDYNPDTGKPIVGLPRSHHYEHSTYVDLILSGLVGIRPRADEVLEVDPLLAPGSAGDRPVGYFAVDGVRYHGHDVGVVWDVDGTRYGIGRGLSVFVDGRRVSGPGALARVEVPLRKASARAPGEAMRNDLAVNVGVPEGPLASASSSAALSPPGEAIDGRMWFFPEIANGWSPVDVSAASWFAVDLRKSRTLGSIELYFLADGDRFRAPAEYTLQYKAAAGWQEIPGQRRMPEQPVAGGEIQVTFPALAAEEIRVVITPPTAPASLRLLELKAFAP